jgi:hypothetical protein
MGARETYQSSVASAEATKLATLQKATLTAQESINAVGVNAGKNPMLGVALADDATIRAANKTLQASQLSAEATKQTSINSARSILQQTDTAPA